MFYLQSEQPADFLSLQSGQDEAVFEHSAHPADDRSLFGL